jgi:hypothetical protein
VKPGVRLPLADALRNPPSTGAEHYITGQDAEGNEATFVVDPKTHKAVPVEFPEGYSPGKPAAEKPAKYTYEHFVDDAGKVTHIRHTDAEDDIPQILKGGKWVAAEGGEAVGPKRKDPDAVKGPKAATPTQINTINNRRRVGLARAEAAFKKAMAAASMGGYTDTEKAAQALEDLHQAKQSAQDAYEGELSEFGIPFEHVEYSENTRPAQNAPAAPAKAEQQQTPALAPQAQGSTPTSQAKGKLTDQNKAKVYIQRAGGDKERARALAKADGWEF